MSKLGVNILPKKKLTWNILVFSLFETGEKVAISDAKFL